MKKRHHDHVQASHRQSMALQAHRVLPALLVLLFVSALSALSSGPQGQSGAQDRSSPPPAPTSTFFEDPELIAFVGVQYKHGLPYTRGRSFSPDRVPLLLDLLERPDQEPYLHNIVLMLGLIGDESVTPHLIRFLERRYTRRVTQTQLWALQTVNVALGNLANRGDEKALEYLLQGQAPDFWGNNRIRWTYRGLSAQDRGVLMAKLAIYGLALSASPEARQRLEQLERTGARELGENVRGALRLIGRIEVEGIDRVFETRD